MASYQSDIFETSEGPVYVVIEKTADTNDINDVSSTVFGSKGN